VQTETVVDAGTDDDVRITVFGKTSGGADVNDLLDFSDIVEGSGNPRAELFARGGVDHFSFELFEIGEPNRLRVEVMRRAPLNEHADEPLSCGDGDGGGDERLANPTHSWRPTKVVLINPATKMRYQFDCTQWVAVGHAVDLALTLQAPFDVDCSDDDAFDPAADGGASTCVDARVDANVHDNGTARSGDASGDRDEEDGEEDDEECVY
jgi:hypothetical protein